VVEEEGVLEGEEAPFVRVHYACVLNNVYIRWRPSCCNIGYDHLLQDPPITREAYEEGSLLGDVWRRWATPFWNWR